jgi:hypothetical protein
MKSFFGNGSIARQIVAGVSVVPSKPARDREQARPSRVLGVPVAARHEIASTTRCTLTRADHKWGGAAPSTSLARTINPHTPVALITQRGFEGKVWSLRRSLTFAQ